MTRKLEKKEEKCYLQKDTTDLSDQNSAGEWQLVDQVIVKINHLIFPKYDTSTTT